MRTLLLLGLILVSTPVFAEEVPDNAEAARARLQELLEANKYSEALRFADGATSAHPGDADLHYRYGLLLGAVNDRQKAIAELEAAERLLPGEPSVLADLALAYYNAGNELAARETAEKVLAREASNEAAKSVLVELDARDRIRARKQPAVAPGSPAAAVHEAFTMAASGDMAAVVDRYLDPSVFDELTRGLDGDRAEVRRLFLRGFQEAIGKNVGELVGFEVQPETTTTGAVTEVTVRFLIRQTTTKTQVDQQIALVESSLGAKALPAESRDLILALDPADRRAMFERLVGTPNTYMTSGYVTLSQLGRAWKITDVALDTGGTRLSLRALLGNQQELMALADLPRSPAEADPMNDRAYRLGYGVGRLLGFLAIAGLVIWLIRRRRRS